MRARSLIPLLTCALAMTACTSSQAGSPASSTGASRPADLVILESAGGVMALNAGNGSVPFSGDAVPAFADWSRAFTTARQGTTTVLRAIQTGTGEELSHDSVQGDLRVRVASNDGTRVALMAPLRSGASPWSPESRTWTDIVVADPSGATPSQRYHLRGNFEPEAFSVDDSQLFLISYLPPVAPTSYRVMSLDLAQGRVHAVFGREKGWTGSMTGTRLMQVPAANGTFLFTLYSNQPARLANGYDAVQASAGRTVAFVHTLNLDIGQAVCVGLPRVLWGGNPAYEAIAASPTDTRVFVVDTSRGVVVVMRSDSLRVDQRAAVDFGLPGVGTQTQASVSPDGSRLYVSTGRAVVVLDAFSLVPLATWNAPDPVSGLGLSADGRRLFLSYPGEVQATDPTSGRPLDTIRLGGVEGIRSILPPSGP